MGDFLITNRRIGMLHTNINEAGAGFAICEASRQPANPTNLICRIRIGSVYGL